MKAIIASLPKLTPNRQKQKSADPYGPNHNPETYFPQPSYPYHAQPHLQAHQLPPQHYVPQHQVYQHHQPIQMPLSPCPYQQYQCQPPHIIQSPQQSVSCATLPNQYQNGTVTNRTTDSTLVMNCQTQQYPPVQMTLPTYQSNQAPVTVSNQSFRCTDNLYYNDGNYNHQAAPIMMQVQNQQVITQHQPTQNQIIQQRQKQQQYEQQMIHQQQQQAEVQKHQQQVNQQHFEVQKQEHNQQQQNYQNQYQLQEQQQQLLYQQQYSNHEIVKEAANGYVEFPLEVNCIMHETRHKELTEIAKILKNDLSKLTTELEIIRKELPDYSVNEERI